MPSLRHKCAIKNFDQLVVQHDTLTQHPGKCSSEEVMQQNGYCSTSTLCRKHIPVHLVTLLTILKKGYHIKKHLLYC